jgi:hypothetical protein
MSQLLTAIMDGNASHADKIELRNRAILQGMGERDIFRQFPGIARGTFQRRMKPVSWTVTPQEGIGLRRLAFAEIDDELEQNAQMRVEYDALTERVQDLEAKLAAEPRQKIVTERDRFRSERDDLQRQLNLSERNKESALSALKGEASAEIHRLSAEIANLKNEIAGCIAQRQEVDQRVGRLEDLKRCGVVAVHGAPARRCAAIPEAERPQWTRATDALYRQSCQTASLRACRVRGEELLMGRVLELQHQQDADIDALQRRVGDGDPEGMHRAVDSMWHSYEERIVVARDALESHHVTTVASLRYNLNGLRYTACYRDVMALVSGMGGYWSGDMP